MQIVQKSIAKWSISIACSTNADTPQSICVEFDYFGRATSITKGNICTNKPTMIQKSSISFNQNNYKCSIRLGQSSISIAQYPIQYFDSCSHLKIEYKNVVLSGNVRSKDVMVAMRHLSNMTLYKNEGIVINNQWEKLFIDIIE